MKSPLPVRINFSAARAIEDAAKWWIANRPKAPDAFVIDLENALKLIASHPEIGARALNAKIGISPSSPFGSRPLSPLLPSNR